MTRCLLVAVLAVGLDRAAHAHFVFVVPAADGTTLTVVMSESLEPDDAVGLGPVAGLKLMARSLTGRDSAVALTAHDHHLAAPAAPRSVVFGSLDYGVTSRGGQSFLLKYHPKAIVGGVPARLWGVGDRPADIVPEVVGSAVRFRVLARGMPAKAAVTVIEPGGGEAKVEAGADGWTRVFATTGRYGIWARVVEESAGSFGGQAYGQVRHYPTLVFDHSGLPPLPEAVSSFGAASADGWAYVYGGHRAKVHSYDSAAVTGRFHRLRLDRPESWQELPAGPPLQGLALVAHGPRVVRIGGMAPRNPPGAKTDNHSTAEVTIYDPAARAWQPLPPLPVPRSSHDAAVVGDTLVVVGGWNTRGPDGNDWFDETLLLDLRRPDSGWVAVPQPFRRRAFQVAALGGKVFVVGGLDEDGNVMTNVEVFDPVAKSWSNAPPIPGEDRAGFSPGVAVTNGRLIVSAGDGSVLQLSTDGTRWDNVAKVAPRVVHRAVPADRSTVLLLGGAFAGVNLDQAERVTINRAEQPRQ